MKVLFIGGNGNISWHCVDKLIKEGHDVWELNRSATRTTRRAVQPQVHQIICDIRDTQSARTKLKNIHFDVVCDFICYNENHAQKAIELFFKITDQYIFISSEAVYKRSPEIKIFNEKSEKYAPSEISGYAQGKVMAENLFIGAYQNNYFPVTIVRPGYTYDTIMPVSLGHNCFTAVKKVLAGYPVLVYGDGENLCSPMHSSDFARAFTSLVGNNDSIGHSFNITSDKTIKSNEMATIVMDELNIKNKEIIHIPYEDLIKLNIIKDIEITKQHISNYVFDNSEIKRFAAQWEPKIDFRTGIRKTIAWLMEDSRRQRIDANFDKELDLLYKLYWRH